VIKIEKALKTSVTYNGTGSQTRFDFPFDYLRKSFVRVSVDNEPMDNTADYTIDSRTVVFHDAPPSNSVIRIYRETDTSRLVVWADASVLKASDMTIQQVQQLHILEEANDWTKTNSIVLNDEGNAWQGRNYRVSNVSDPTEAQDVVTKNYLENTEDSFVQRMNAIKTQTEQFANTAGNSKDSAYKSAQDASISAASAAESAGEAKTYKDNAKTYMDNAKNYSENVNVFLPSVSSEGVLSWTNKAGLTNPASVNIKGAKGDRGLQGVQGVQGVKGDKGDKGDTGAKGATGTAASIKIGSVTTGAAGSNASVTNSGTASSVVLNFTLPRGKDGKDGGITVDAELNDTSTNPIQNKAVNAGINELAKYTEQHLYNINAAMPTKVSALENDAGYLTQQSLAGYAKTSVANTWTTQQNFYVLMLNREKYITYVVSGTSDTPIISTMVYAVTGAFTLDLAILAGALSASQSSVFTAYFAANADYSLTINNAGKLKYTGSASDVAITSAGMLLNVLMTKDANGNLTSIVQASKLS